MIYRESGQFKTSYKADQAILPIFQDKIAMVLLMIFAFIGIPLIANDYWLGSILIPFLALSLAALGLNVLTGYAGQISLGTAAFMAVGAFAAFNLQVRVPEIPFLIAFLWGGLCAAGVGILFGLPSLRIKGFYLAVATLAAQFFIEWLFTHFDWFTNYLPKCHVVDNFSKDEEPLKFNEEKLFKLKPAFDSSGSITAGNASSLSDGAAALLIASEKIIKEKNIKPIAKIIDHVSFATEPLYFTKAPIYAIEKLLKKVNMCIEDIDLFEINEAFSCVTMAAIDELKISPTKVNVNGGAVSMGHPIGASGARILVTLLGALKKKKLKYGIASLCIGGGEASALLVEICE